MPQNPADLLSSVLEADFAAAEVATPSRRWFYTQDGERYGPVTGPELRAAAQLEFLGPADEVRCGPAGVWVRASEIRGLFGKARSSA